MWAKIPAAVACAACIAGATAVAVPVIKSSDSHLAKTIASQVNLTAFDVSPLLSLSSLDGIPAWLDFAFNDGGLYSFVAEGDWPGYDLLGGAYYWQNFLTDGTLSADDYGLSGIDAFSAVADLAEGNPFGLSAFDAVPAYAALLSGEGTVSDLNGLDSVNAAYSFNEFLNGGGLASFEYSEDENGNVVNPGYDVLSGAATWQRFIESGGDVSELSTIDAFSAIPNWQNFLDSGGTDISADGLGGIDAFSALPAFQQAVNPPEDPEAQAKVSGSTEGATSFSATANASEDTTEAAADDTTDTKSSDLGTGLKQLSDKVSAALPQIKAPEAVKTPEVKTEAKVSAPEVSTGTTQTGLTGSVTAGDTPAAAPAADKPVKSVSSTKAPAASKPEAKDGTTESSTGSYSGVFAPKKKGEEIIYGSGGGVDNGIRGWGDALKKLGIGGGDSSDGGSDSGSGDGGGE